MSSSAKRKADDMSGVGAGPRKAATIAHGWADLPAELVLRIGRLHDEPRDVVIMERTCRSWRKVVMEEDSDPQVLVANAQSLEERMQACLWRDLALMKFPALPSIVNALQDKERKGTPHSAGHLTGDAETTFSWKSMCRSQHCVAKLPAFYSPRYCPKTTVDDYIFSYEFRRHLTNELLFVTSGGLDEESPQLWSQKIIPSNDGEFPKLKGPADPRLIALLGDDPFSETKIRDIDLRVVVTRISDMKAVELSSFICLASEPDDGGDIEYHDEGCSLIMASERFGDGDDEVISRYAFAPNLLRNDAKWTLSLIFSCNTGCIRFCLERYIVFERQDSSSAPLDEVASNMCAPCQILEYLETRCPFGK